MRQPALPTPSLLSTFVAAVRGRACAHAKPNAALSAVTPLERRVMLWLFRRLLRQSWAQSRLTEAFTTLSQVARQEFHEDNDPTVDHFLRECLETAISKTSVAPARFP